jgi:hypothetical protein
MVSTAYMTFINMCSVFWKNSPQLREQLKNRFPQYRFLGICGILWNFMPVKAKSRWYHVTKDHTSEALKEIEELARLTLEQTK